MTESTREWYLRAARELAGTSARQVEWCLGVADDLELLELLEGLPRPARQPSLLFAVAALLGAPREAYPGWAVWIREHADAVAAELPRRRVQTNEPLRCIPLLVALARIPGPIALVELGASAGLCLLPDRYGYRFRTPGGELTLGGGSPVLDASIDDAALAPTAMPDIRWRVGIDLAPLDLGDSGDRRWLAASLPPDAPEREDRLAAAIATAASDPPRLVSGDALRMLPSVVAQAPAGLTLVVASLGTAVYLPRVDRTGLLAFCTSLGARTVVFEPRGALPSLADRWNTLAANGRADPDATFLLALDGEPIASASAHGDRLRVVRPAGRHGTATARA